MSGEHEAAEPDEAGRGGPGARRPGQGRDGAGDALDAPFRPRAARWVSGVLAVAVAAGTVVLLVALPTAGLTGYSTADRAGFVLVGAGIVWFCWRQATVRAVPTADGLVVRNLATTRTVSWSEIVLVRFGEGRAWVQLDLADGDTLAVMGVQRSDGQRAREQARRLATLVAARTRTPRDD